MKAKYDTLQASTAGRSADTKKPRKKASAAATLSEVPEVDKSVPVVIEEDIVQSGRKKRSIKLEVRFYPLLLFVRPAAKYC